MSLTNAEKRELTRLAARCVDKDGKPLPDADTKDLKRLEEMLAKFGPEDESKTSPVKAKNHKLSLEGQGLVERGAEYLGCEARNFGTQEKPKLVWREFFYRTTADKKRECIMVQGDQVIVIGRTLAASALNRIGK